MTVRTQVVRDNEQAFTDQDILKVAELGGESQSVSSEVANNQQTVIRKWPSLESAQAWCDYITTLEGVISAEIVTE